MDTTTTTTTTRIRYIKVPPPITLFHPVTHARLIDDKTREEIPPLPFVDLVEKMLLNPRWDTEYDWLKAKEAIKTAIATTGNGPYMILAEEDWQKLVEAVKKPARLVDIQGENGEFRTVMGTGYGYHQLVLPQMIPHMDAIIEATSKLPDDMGKNKQVIAR